MLDFLSARCLLLAWGLCLPGLAGAAPQLRYIGQASLPTGMVFKEHEVGGLSGIDYRAQDDRYVAISDDRGAHGPVRFYTLQIDLADGMLSDGDVHVVAQTTILDRDGQAFPPGTADAESIRATGFPGLLYWTSEGDAAVGRPSFVRIMS